MHRPIIKTRSLTLCGLLRVTLFRRFQGKVVFSGARRDCEPTCRSRSRTRRRRPSPTGGNSRLTSASRPRRSTSGCSRTHSTLITRSRRRSRVRSCASGSTAPQRASSRPYKGGDTRVDVSVVRRQRTWSTAVPASPPCILHFAFALHLDIDARRTSSSTVARSSSSSESRRARSLQAAEQSGTRASPSEKERERKYNS